MMKTYKQRTNGNKNKWAKAGLEKPPTKRSFLKADLRREAWCFEAFQDDKRVSEWQQIFNRWWDLIFDKGGRRRIPRGQGEPDRLTIGKNFKLFQILGPKLRIV